MILLTKIEIYHMAILVLNERQGSTSRANSSTRESKNKLKCLIFVIMKNIGGIWVCHFK